MRKSFVELTHVRLAYYEVKKGSGPVFLWIHGMYDAAEHFMKVNEYMPEGTHVFVDLPGHGESVVLGESSAFLHTPESYAAVLAEFLRVKGDSATHVIGNSLGGATALYLGLRSKSLVRSLFVYSVPLSFHMGGWFVRIGARLIPFLTKVFTREGVAYALATAASFTKEGRRHLFAINKKANAQVAKKELLALSSMTLLEELKLLEVPTMMIVGEKDVAIRALVRGYQKLGKHHPYIQCQVVPGVGHVFDVDKPQLFMKLLGNFIKRKIKFLNTKD